MLSVRDVATQTLPVKLTINNLNKFVVRHFEDQALSGLKSVFTRTRAQFRLVLVKTGIRPSLTPALRLGLVDTRHTWALALMAQQPVCERTRSGRHEVVHVIYCQSHSIKKYLENITPSLSPSHRGREKSLSPCGRGLVRGFFQKLNCYQ